LGSSLSIYFFTGDFHEAYRRHQEGAEQDYATHIEIGKLIDDLTEAGTNVRIHTFVSNRRDLIRCSPKLEFVSLGATSYADKAILRRAIEEDPSSAIIPHFPDHGLLQAVIRSDRRSIAILASSYYRRSLRAPFQRWQLARYLNSARFDLISNHCLPATCHLADMGVSADKLAPWDIPHRYRPDDCPPKVLSLSDPVRIAYAGSVSEAKGVGDLIRAVSKLRALMPVECTIAGSGEIDRMRALVEKLGLEASIHLIGQVRNNEVFDLFRQSDLIVVPSRHEFPEGFPLTFFEAIASRTPILCSDHPIFCKVIEHRRNALIFRAADPSALAEAATDCLNDPELYAILSKNGVETWKKLEGPADWRTLIREWFYRGPSSPWIEERMLGHTGARRQSDEHQ
jgi:glycosyltransferase involved in cell wall biosynthesis